MTDEKLKQLVTSLAAAQKSTDKQFKELGKQIGGNSPCYKTCKASGEIEL